MFRKIGTILIIGLLSAAVIGCGKKDSDKNVADSGKEEAGYKNDVSTDSLKDAVAEALGENYWPNMSIEADMLESMTELNSDSYDEFTAEMPMISTNVDTLIIVKAKDGAGETVKEALSKYQENLKNDTLQYPMNLPKIQASKIETYGNYVCYVQLGADTQAAADESEEAAIKYCEGENRKALDAIEKALKK